MRRRNLFTLAARVLLASGRSAFRFETCPAVAICLRDRRMRISRMAASILLVVTLIPLCYAFVTFVYLLTIFLSARITDDSLRRSADLLVVGNLIAFVWTWGLIAIYVRFCFRSATVPKDQKVLWVVVLVLLNVMAMPVFWFKFIWPPIRNSEQMQ
jgi:hypothetical protein